jgi:hypothetical protein
MFCKEKLLYAEGEVGRSIAVVGADVSCSLVELVRSLMGAPPEFSHIVAVADFLLLVHRASATFVSHARANCYFLLTAAEPLNLPEKRTARESRHPVDPSKLNKALANLQIKRQHPDLDSNRVFEERQNFLGSGTYDLGSCDMY